MGRTIFLILLLIIYGNLFSLMSENRNIQRTNLTFLDIGIGDSTIVRSHGKTIFIDGGPEDNILYKLGKYLKVGQSIDLVIITHFHNDHYSGIYEILERYDVGEVWVPNVCDGRSKLSILSEMEVKIRYIGGEVMMVPITPLSILYAVSAHIDTRCFSGEDANRSSIVVVFEHEGSRAILMGDAYIDNEKDLMAKFPELFRESTILKAGHHCSKTSASKAFLEYVAPKYVICSTGRDNTYGHPDPIVISRLEGLGIKYFLTYMDGDISFDL